MPLQYLIDENLRGTLAIALLRMATRYGLSLDVTQVGDTLAPELGTTDPDILIWAEKDERILLSRDRRTMGVHLAEHLSQGHHSPGVFIILDAPLSTVADYLVLVAFTSDASEWKDRIAYVP